MGTSKCHGDAMPGHRWEQHEELEERLGALMGLERARGSRDTLIAPKKSHLGLTCAR